MCGIAGIAAWSPVADLPRRIATMAQQLRHRGPDDAGTWFDAERGIGFGHRRLSIIDLSPAGHQPMASASGRFVIVYNGEIYNYAAIRTELEGIGQAPRWRGHSDTEALLAGFEAWGVPATLSRTVGMFAMAVWDRDTRSLTLARDRLGEKPLYYGVIGGQVQFASELKALQHGDAQTPLSIDRDAVAEFMRFGYVPAPRSIYRGVFKLPAGHWLTLRAPGDTAAPQPYWSADDAAAPAERARWADRSDAELVEALHERLRDAVSLQMVASDVPIGAFLSGGVDSSTVVALMQAHSERPVRTFTIGFENAAFDEAPYARAVARHLGTDHTELRVGVRAALDLIAELPSIYDEPFGDSSQIPTTLVARMTRRHVTVSLSGDGGDELFAGYPRYPTTAGMWQRLGRHRPALRSAASQLLGGLSARSWDRVFACLPGGAGGLNGRRIHRLAQMLPAHDLGEAYLRLMSHWQPEQGIVPGATPVPVGPRRWADADAPIAAMRRWDLGQYLPDDLLVKVDRAAMSAGLESRAPFLDHRVVELALALPEHVLVRGGTGKWLLRQVLDRYVPRALIERPKAGFEVPLAEWLRGPLRPWAESLLERASVARAGLLDPLVVERAWREHLDGSFDRAQLLWNALMLQAWWLQVAPTSPAATRTAADPAPCPA